MPQDVAEMNRQTGGSIDAAMDPDEVMRRNTRSLMDAVSNLPQLTERKRTIDKHTNLATALLAAIKAHSLDQFYNLEETILAGKADLAMLEREMQV